jgi:hypothetical protein
VPRSPALLPLLLWSALVVGTAGCLQRSLPLPPPSVTAQSVVACPPAECPGGGVIVTLEGSAQPRAEVLLQDTAAHATAPTGESLFVGTTATETGAWRLVLGPVRVRGPMTVLAPRTGDALNLFQILAPPAYEVSSSRILVVGAPSP